MKSYEHTEKVPPYQPFIVRADGKNFSKFTSGLESPFDDRFYRAMVNTANKLLGFFNARTVFVCSDEITLVFDRIMSREEFDQQIQAGETPLTHPYSGRRFKIETLVAAKASVLFNRFMLQEVSGDKSYAYKDSVIARIRDMDAIFDARLIVFGQDHNVEIVNNLIWRSCYECYRNAVSTYARHHLGKRAIFKRNSIEMIQMMREKGVDWEQIPLHYKYGVYCKKILVELENEGGDKYVRGQTKNFSICIRDIPIDQAITMLLAKYYELVSV